MEATMTDYEYYKGQIERLGTDNLEYAPTMKLHGDKGESKHLNLNETSLKALIDYCMEMEIISSPFDFVKSLNRGK